MNIYRQELIDGLKDRILGSTSVAFATRLESNTNSSLNELIQKAFANKLDSKQGLYPTKSILVSTVWNLNDDVFDKAEVWLAKSTPEDKPTNLDHDEKKIVGHITGNWPITEDGKPIPADTTVDELPDIYHIVNSAVIYTLWQDKDLADRTKALIDEIENDKKYVSMECVFSGFDYAVVAPDGKHYVVARSSENAFLTKHLRAYGGDGTYQGCKLGRLLRNITFSGKGYVDKPANPDSIILKAQDFSFSTAKQNNILFNNDGVLIFSAASGMGDIETMSAEIELNKKIAELEVALVKANAEIKNSTDKVSDVTKSLDKTGADLATANDNLKSTNDKLTAEVAKSAELTKALDETNKAKATVDKELSEIKAEASKAKRIAHLVENGVAKDVAETKVLAFVTFSDEQFKVVAEALVAAAKAGKIEKPEGDIDEDKAGEVAAKAAKDAADKAAAEAKAKLVLNPTAEEDKKLETVRASIADRINLKFGIKTNKE